MSHFDVLIKGGTVISGTGAVPADVAVSGERIAAVLPPGNSATAAKVIDATGRYVLPGMIDSHVHFRTPGLVHKETWATGSRAAVAGGVTTVIDMPNTRPPLVTPADAEAKHRMIDGTSLVDYRFHAGVDPRKIEAVRDFSPREAVSVKIFLCGHHTAPDVVRDAADLERLFVLAAGHGLRLLFHAEDDSIFELLDAWRGLPASFADYEPHRPRTGGIVAVARLVELARRHGTQVHVVHVSSREEVDLLAAAAAAGIPITFEVTPHHLTFTDDDTRDVGTRLRLRPAIRSSADRDHLWQAVIEGLATTVGSDHAPHTVTEKGLPVADAPPGLPGVQELFPALLTGLRERSGLSADKVLSIAVRLLAEEPARLFGLAHRKGRVEAGVDADLVLLDADRRWIFDPADVQALCGWSAYAGREFQGRVELTMRRGEVVYERLGGLFGAAAGIWLDAGSQRVPGE